MERVGAASRRRSRRAPEGSSSQATEPASAVPTLSMAGRLVSPRVRLAEPTTSECVGPCVQATRAARPGKVRLRQAANTATARRARYLPSVQSGDVASGHRRKPEETPK